MTANKTKWVRLGDYIEAVDERNREGKYTVEDVRGVANTKGFIYTKANISDRDLSSFQVVNPTYFAFNRRTTRNGERLGLGYNDTHSTFICTEDYVVFKIKDEKRGKLHPCFLYILFLRDEFDRYVRYDSWGSATEFFNWSNMQDIRIPLSSMKVQRDLVATYEGLKRLAEDNEALIAPLTEACQAFIVDCKRQYPSVPLGEYIEEVDERNTERKYSVEDVRGISIDKIFIDTKANMEGVVLTPYKLVKPSEFCYVSVTSRNGDKISLAANSSEQTYIVSSSYEVFRCKKALLPEYIYLLLSRSEFDRYARFNSWGSARESFSWEELCRVQIPLPPLEVQQSIVNLYHCMEEAKSIAREARESLATLCPALVQYAIEA
jgi:hypothetical protein